MFINKEERNESKASERFRSFSLDSNDSNSGLTALLTEERVLRGMLRRKTGGRQSGVRRKKSKTQIERPS